MNVVADTEVQGIQKITAGVVEVHRSKRSRYGKIQRIAAEVLALAKHNYVYGMVEDCFCRDFCIFAPLSRPVDFPVPRSLDFPVSRSFGSFRTSSFGSLHLYHDLEIFLHLSGSLGFFVPPRGSFG